MFSNQERNDVFGITFIKVLIILLLVNNTVALKCYVCGPDEGLKNCDNFNPSNENLYAKQCSPSSYSCSAQTKEHNIISMSCEDQKFNDCQTANGIEFCYCIVDLCNGIKPIHKPTVADIDPIDDEDLTEGSGSTDTIPTLHATFPPLNTGYCLRGTFIIIAASVLIP